MSFDMAVLYPEKPLAAGRAAGVYHELCDGNYGVLPPSGRIDRFYKELTARYPDLGQLSEAEAEASPWSTSLDVSDGAVLLCIRWSRADEMSAYVSGLTARHGLACYDPQIDVINLPPTLSA